MSDDDFIKITIKVKRYIAGEIESAIEKYISGEGEPEYDDKEMVESLDKVKRVIGRASMRNKTVNQ